MPVDREDNTWREFICVTIQQVESKDMRKTSYLAARRFK